MSSRPQESLFDAEIDGHLVEVKFGVTALRSIREGLLQLAYAMAERPDRSALLILPDVSITRERLDQEWRRAASVLKPGLARRLTLCVPNGAGFIGIPRDLDSAEQRVVRKALLRKRPQDSHPIRGDASFAVIKILLNHWVTNGEPVTTDWLTRASGFSYPTVAAALDKLGGLIERESDRRLRLRRFSLDTYLQLLAASARARSTARFIDRSGQSLSPESLLRRLEKLRPDGLAIGGALGARHYVPDLDLVGLPRLDLSQHRPGQPLDLDFIHALDPALERVDDSLEPATVVVHAVRHADPLFTARKGGLPWADPIECLLDLREANLRQQAGQLYEALEKRREGA
ncbi:MAG TPA: hypothetical protein VL123_08480 [Candidatus Udaeobacter sp.]|nr:hypothetical protein [Candidatus Udaeobacter sp.]